MQKNIAEISSLLFLLILFVIGLIYIIRTNTSLATRPMLEVSLSEETVTDQSVINLTGQTDPGSHLVVNNTDVNVSDEGDFSYDLAVPLGESAVDIVSTKSGKTTSLERTVVRQEVSRDILGSSSSTEGSVDMSTASSDDLAQSGPGEVIWGVTGITLLIISAIYYLDKNGNYLTNKTIYKQKI